MKRHRISPLLALAATGALTPPRRDPEVMLLHNYPDESATLLRALEGLKERRHDLIIAHPPCGELDYSRHFPPLVFDHHHTFHHKQPLTDADFDAIKKAEEKRARKAMKKGNQ